MLTARERSLLIVLCVLAGLAAMYFSSTLLGNMFDELDTKIKKQQELNKGFDAVITENASLYDDAALENTIQQINSKLYEPYSVSSYEFGLQVRKLLDKHGLSVSLYNVDENEYSVFVNINFASTSLQFFTFLNEAANKQNKYWRFSQINIKKEQANRISGILRIEVVYND